MITSLQTPLHHDRPVAVVTGGAGFIGSHTCKQLFRDGYQPVAYDNLSAGCRDFVKWGPLVEGDILDTDALVRTLRAHRPAAVIHLAASGDIGEPSEPTTCYRNNVAGTLSLLEACRLTGTRNVVFSSSSAAYAVPDTGAAPHTPQHVNAYGRTKRIGEQMLADYAAGHGLRFAALRSFNAAGADPDGELFERHAPETHLIPRALLAAFHRVPRLDVHGSDYPTPDGTSIGDYIHVSDLARAHVLAMRRLLAGGASLALDVGSGRGSSVVDVVKTVRNVTGRSFLVSWHPGSAGDPPVFVADPACALAEIGFSAELSDLETIVRSAAAIFRDEAAKS